MTLTLLLLHYFYFWVEVQVKVKANAVQVFNWLKFLLVLLANMFAIELRVKELKPR